jgi:pimeloyl-ACP methyl ester carboxylesterase
MVSRNIVGGTIGLAALVLVLVLAAAPASAAGLRPDVHVYLLRGLMNIWSTGLDELGDKIERRHIKVSVVNHLEASTIAERAIADYRAGRLRHVVFIGHSWGAGGALLAASELNDARVPVDLVVTFDAGHGATVAPNVRRLVNFYISSGLGAPVRPAKGFHGILQNVDVSRNPSIGHLNIEKDPKLHAQVIRLVLSAVGQRRR